MKKIICIAVCILGLISLSSCRSTSSSCGLASNSEITNNSQQFALI